MCFADPSPNSKQERNQCEYFCITASDAPGVGGGPANAEGQRLVVHSKAFRARSRLVTVLLSERP